MTTVPTPDPGSPTSPAELSQLVDDLEERSAAEVARERSSDDADARADDHHQDEDVTGNVPGAPEPPD